MKATQITDKIDLFLSERLIIWSLIFFLQMLEGSIDLLFVLIIGDNFLLNQNFLHLFIFFLDQFFVGASCCGSHIMA